MRTRRLRGLPPGLLEELLRRGFYGTFRYLQAFGNVVGQALKTQSAKPDGTSVSDPYVSLRLIGVDRYCRS